MYLKKTNCSQMKFLILALVFNNLIFPSSQLESSIENCDARLFFHTLLDQINNISDTQVRALLALTNNKKMELKKELNLAQKAGVSKIDTIKIGLAVSGIALSAWFAKNSLWSSEWKKSENSIFNTMVKKFYAEYNYCIYDSNLTFWSAIFALLGSGSVAYLCSEDKVQFVQDNLIKINAIEYILKKSKNTIDRLEIGRILDGKFVEKKKNHNLYTAGLLGALSSGISIYSALALGNTVFDNISILDKTGKKISRIKLQAGAVATMTCAAVYCLFKNRLQASDLDENLNFYKELASKNV